MSAGCGCGYDAQDRWQDCLIHKIVLTYEDRQWLAEWPSAVDAQCPSDCYDPCTLEYGPAYPCAACVARQERADRGAA